jgi:hypothetical protein
LYTLTTPSNWTSSGTGSGTTPPPTTLVDPINPSATAVVTNLSAYTQRNNTSTDTHSYLDISTFSATSLYGLTGSPALASSNATAGADTASGPNSPSTTVTSTQVINPSSTPATTTTTSNAASVSGYSSAVTSNVGNNSSPGAATLFLADGSMTALKFLGMGFAGVAGLLFFL